LGGVDEVAAAVARAAESDAAPVRADARSGGLAWVRDADWATVVSLYLRFASNFSGGAPFGALLCRLAATAQLVSPASR
ncbi:hypothetical protein K6L09_45110, partial [Burkholderia cepacia]